MRIALAQLNYHIGNFEGNLIKMKRAVQEARSQGADLVCFGELATCGYPPRDFLEFDDFIRQAESSVKALAQESFGIGIIVGSPTPNPVVEGKDLFNAAFVLSEGEIIHQSHKALLPTYDIFDEYRYFEPAKSFSTFEFRGKRIALTICEDVWNIGNENPLYTTCPMDHLIKDDPDLMINISASPFAYDHAAERIEVMQENSRRYRLPFFYINNVGAQTELIFDGGSMVLNDAGQIIEELPYFEETVRTHTLAKVQVADEYSIQDKDKMDLIYRALILGIRDYFGKLGFSEAIVGLSGGIDSAVTTVLAADALGADNVCALLMPSQFSSDHSVADAKELAENLGIRHHVIPIQTAFEAIDGALDPLFGDLPFSIAEENIQARVRGIILMAMSNKFGPILLNTSNKSEAAVGYGTLYGDMAGGLSVIGDLYKTEVIELAHYINRNGIIIPANTIEKPPSAELRPNQKDSDSLPDYQILDEILYQYIEKRQGPKEIVDMGFDKALVSRILRLVNINEFKRHQTPPVLRVSQKAFGMGRRMPIVGKYLS